MSNVPMTRPDEVIAVHELGRSGPITFVELEDGRVLGAGQNTEGSTFTISDDGAVTWSAPVERGDSDGGPMLVKGLVRLSGNSIGACGVQGWHTRQSRLLFWRSDDAGETWEPPVEVTPHGAGIYIYQDMLLRTSSGRIILPVYLGLGRRPRPEEPQMALSGKLVNNEFRPTPAHYFDPMFSLLRLLLLGRRWADLGEVPGRRTHNPA